MLEQLRDQDVNIYGKFPWKIPAIEPTVVLAKPFMEQLEMDKNSCEETVKEIIESVETAEREEFERELLADWENEHKYADGYSEEPVEEDSDDGEFDK